MPLMSVQYPSNVQYFLNLLVEFINFDIIPTDKIIEKVFKIKEKADDTTTTVLSALGYKSTNLL